MSRARNLSKLLPDTTGLLPTSNVGAAHPKLLLNGANDISGAKLVSRASGLATTNGNNESTGCIIFPARIMSGTNLIIATASNITSSSMAVATCEFINIYDWSQSSYFRFGIVQAAIRGSSTGATSANTLQVNAYTNGASSGPQNPTFNWTGTTSFVLNLQGASSNEGIATIKIAWRDCTMSITPSV